MSRDDRLKDISKGKEELMLMLRTARCHNKEMSDMYLEVLQAGMAEI